jgi:hypothetical protein
VISPRRDVRVRIPFRDPIGGALIPFVVRTGRSHLRPVCASREFNEQFSEPIRERIVLLEPTRFADEFHPRELAHVVLRILNVTGQVGTVLRPAFGGFVFREDFAKLLRFGLRRGDRTSVEFGAAELHRHLASL